MHVRPPALAVTRRMLSSRLLMKASNVGQDIAAVLL